MPLTIGRGSPEQMNHMNPRTALPIILCFTLFSNCRSLPSSSSNFERSYVSGLRLSAVEERKVIEQAAILGVTEIKAIETFFVQPGGGPAIQVLEVETVADRMVKYRTIGMHWETSEATEFVEGEKPKGKIIARQPTTFEQNILASGGKEYRVTLKEGVSPSKAEEILECFLGERIRYARTETPEETYGRVNDYTDPSSVGFNKARKLHSISFKGSNRLSTYYGSIEGNVFVIQKVVTFMS